MESVFGKRLEQIQPHGKVIPLIILQCVEYIRANCMEIEGIFRISAMQSKLMDVKAQFCGNNTVVGLEGMGDHHVVSCVLKLFLREMTEPLLPRACWGKLLDVYREGGAVAADKYVGVLQSLHPSYLINVVYIFQFLKELSQLSEKNLMSAQNLGIVFGPGLMRPPDNDPIMLLEGWDGKIVEHLITLYDEVFSRIGTVAIVPTEEGYEERFTGFLALAMSPRYSVKLQNTIAKKAICKCELLNGITSAQGARSFTVAVEATDRAEDFYTKSAKRLRDVLTEGKMLKLYYISDGKALPMGDRDGVYDRIVNHNISVEVRVLDRTFASSKKAKPRFNRILSTDLKGKLPPAPGAPPLKHTSRGGKIQLSNARNRSPIGQRHGSPQTRERSSPRMNAGRHRPTKPLPQKSEGSEAVKDDAGGYATAPAPVPVASGNTGNEPQGEYEGEYEGGGEYEEAYYEYEEGEEEAYEEAYEEEGYREQYDEQYEDDKYVAESPPEPASSGASESSKAQESTKRNQSALAAAAAAAVAGRQKATTSPPQPPRWARAHPR